MATGSSQASQIISLVGSDAGGVARSGTIRATLLGDIALVPGQTTGSIVLKGDIAGADALNVSNSVSAFYTTAFTVSSTNTAFNVLMTGTQASNGVGTLDLKRFTDSGPTGNFLNFRNTAASQDLFQVDVSGTITRTDNTATVTRDKNCEGQVG